DPSKRTAPWCLARGADTFTVNVVGVESALETHWVDVWLLTLSPPPNFHRFQLAHLVVHGPNHASYGTLLQTQQTFFGRASNTSFPRSVRDPATRFRA